MAGREDGLVTSTPPEPPVDPWATPQGTRSGQPAPPADVPTALYPDIGGTPYGAPPPAYGTYGPAYGTPVAGRGANGLGIAALVLGIVAVLLGVVLVGAVFGLVAIVVGVVGRSRAKQGRATNGGVALAGALLGALGVLIAGAVVVVAFTVFARPIADYRDCLSRSTGDRAAEQVCAENLRRQLDNDLRR
jgi:hypothetical protein